MSATAAASAAKPAGTPAAAAKPKAAGKKRKAGDADTQGTVAKGKKAAAAEKAPVAKRAKGAKMSLEAAMKLVDHKVLKDEVKKYFKAHPEGQAEFLGQLDTRGQGLEQITKELQILRNKVDRAFPYNKYGSNLDTYAFKRVSPAITKLRTRLIAHGTVLKTTKKFPILMEYSLDALDICKGMPEWNSREHTMKTVGPIEKKIGGWLTMAVKGSSVDEVSKFKSRFNEHFERISKWQDAGPVLEALAAKNYVHDDEASHEESGE